MVSCGGSGGGGKETLELPVRSIAGCRIPFDKVDEVGVGWRWVSRLWNFHYFGEFEAKLMPKYSSFCQVMGP